MDNYSNIPARKDDVLRIYTDGASRNNPGPAAWAFVFVKNEKIIHSDAGFIGENTNNVAEYRAAIAALDAAVNHTRGKVELYSDSALLVNQVTGKWKMKKEHLKKLYDEVMLCVRRFEQVKFLQVSRENKFVKKADALCNECLDENLGC
jgi:ribonuclease HI